MAKERAACPLFLYHFYVKNSWLQVFYKIFMMGLTYFQQILIMLYTKKIVYNIAIS